MSAPMSSGYRHHPLAPLPPLNQSCESCRSLKVRCLPDPTVPSQCQRCTRTRRNCVFAHTLRRQPRKKTGSRVAQLEKDLRDLRSLLHGQVRPDSDSGEKAYDAGVVASPTATVPNKLPSFPTTSTSLPPPPWRMESSGSHTASTVGDSSQAIRSFNASPAPTNVNLAMGPSSAGSGDVVDRALISADTAQRLLSVFINDLTQFYPVVVLDQNTDMETLRRTSPVLFLSILSAASLTLDTPDAAVLNEELLKLYAERFFLRQEKSMELIQSILLMLIFYFPPKSRVQGQYYQYAHIATTMALELGIAAGKAGQRNHRCHGEEGDLPVSTHSAQARAVLGCYHFSSNIGMRTHRPNMLCFNSVIEEYTNLLKKSSNILDQQLATWFELQRIIDDTLSSLGHDSTLSDTSLLESQMMPILKWFDSRMLHWKNSTPKDMFTVWMTLEYHYLYLAIYELAAGEGYRDPDAPARKYYTLPPLEGNMERHKANAPLSVARVQIVTKWMLAAHQLLDAFLQCDISTMRKLPNMTYTRIVLGISSLLRIYHKTQFGPLGEVISSQMIGIDGYLDRLSQALLRASGEQKYRVPSKWYHVIAVKNRDWYEKLQGRLIAPPADSYPYLRIGIPPPAPGVPLLDGQRGPGSTATVSSLGGVTASPYADQWYMDDAVGRADSSRPFPPVSTPLMYMAPVQAATENADEGPFPPSEGWRMPDESLQGDVPFQY
ncbi:C6 zinc finger domain protein [Aspergillus heteromorphus CBS 117.55]|uniref:C6 zinc finger domain protein n=1 Tax=Aspergillus heteromorphus CBS 117.55 TaxID=1448321 RepID=A0A317URK1_9EURO|nr:C6 zinc finger domain protein [Aspergillus heteromorphus CBS 117.55]PWY64255.1 C6 zinc finger domain protein [Aspergillus heteromorphus CBS 117.55]